MDRPTEPKKSSAATWEHSTCTISGPKTQVGRHVPGTPDCDWPGELTQRFSIPTIGGSHVSSSYAYKRSTVARMSFITICTWPGSADNGSICAGATRESCARQRLKT